MSTETPREEQVEEARRKVVETGEQKDFDYWWKMRTE